MGRRGRKFGAGLLAAGALCAIAGVGALGTGTAGAADTPTTLTVVSAAIGGRSLTEPTRDNPVVINPNNKAELSMTVRNDGTERVEVRYLRLTGSLLGVHFVRYQASANVVVPPGSTRTIAALGDFFDVDGVASGYMNATMQAVDEHRDVLATQPFVADVQGKVASSEGLLLLQAIVFSLVGIIEIVTGLARRRLPRNRFVRALLFGLTAASVVVTIVVGAAMSRVALWGASTWVPVLLIATGVGFVLGYLSPGRIEKGARDKADDAAIDLVAADAVARASGEVQRVTTGEYAAHASGDHTGAVAAQHESGGFAPVQHDSGEFSAPAQHESGGHEPLA
jgi:hypothetical protein